MVQRWLENNMYNIVLISPHIYIFALYNGIFNLVHKYVSECFCISTTDTYKCLTAPSMVCQTHFLLFSSLFSTLDVDLQVSDVYPTSGRSGKRVPCMNLLSPISISSSKY
jgi:hypothetical protein